MILIKDLKLPGKCTNCPAVGYGLDEDGWAVEVCKTTGKTREMWKDKNIGGRPDWCPMVYVSDNHGGLIDKMNLVDDVNSLALVSEWDRDMVRATVFSERVLVEPAETDGGDADA